MKIFRIVSIGCLVAITALIPGLKAAEQPVHTPQTIQDEIQAALDRGDEDLVQVLLQELDARQGRAAAPAAATPVHAPATQLQFQHYAGATTPIPTWVTQRFLGTQPEQNWWQRDTTFKPRKFFFNDIVGMSEKDFRDHCEWSRRNLFNINMVKGGKTSWLKAFPRRAAIFAGTDDRATGIISIRDLKKAPMPARRGIRPYFSINVFDPYIPWESDIRYLQSIPQNKDAAFQLASTFFGPLEGGIAKKKAYVESMFPSAAQGEEASTSVGGSTIWRKYIMPGTPLYLLHYLQDKLPIIHATRRRPEYAVDTSKYHHDDGYIDKVQVFIQNNAVTTLGYGANELKGHKVTNSLPDLHLCSQSQKSVVSWAN
jgi:hypothetical protein